MSDDARPHAPQSVTRIVQVLDALCAGRGPLSLADLSRALDTPKSSLAALLRGLADIGFVVATDGTFRLGPAAFGLGSALLEARRRLQSPDLVRDGMRRLADRTGETVLFAVRDAAADTLTYVDVIESRNTVRFAVSVGDRRPLYCTAAGRALLATEPDDSVNACLARTRPEARTPHTWTDPLLLAQHIFAIRARGVAQTVDQAADGVTGTAATIHDAAGATLGAMVVAAPSVRWQDRRAALADMVLQEAAAVSRSLGYRPAAA